jgi:FixJ family two-component response regulator
MKEQTVFIIDDDLSAREGLTFLVQAAGLNVESFPSAKEFLDSGKVDGPGCIILDVRMPEMTGPELQEILSDAKYSMPIIFLSAHSDVPTTVRAMKKGAVDFLTKPVDKDTLLEAIQVSFAKDFENRNQLAENSTVKDLLETLSPREYQVMTYVITGMLNKQIAGELAISEVTVKIHRGHIMKKLGIVSVAELVRLCEKVGITPGKTHDK